MSASITFTDLSWSTPDGRPLFSNLDHDLVLLNRAEAGELALVALIFGEPDFLLLDEPTNNLDRQGRAAVIDLLAGWRAGAIVVSHDRELLERCWQAATGEGGHPAHPAECSPTS